MRKLIVLINLVFFNCSFHQITDEMRQGLKFNYKDYGTVVVEGRESLADLKGIKIDTLEHQIQYRFRRQMHSHCNFLGGYSVNNDVLTLYYENTSGSKRDCKCMPTNFVFSFKIDKDKINTKSVNIVELF